MDEVIDNFILIIDNHFFKEAERQLAELRSAEKTNLIQTIRKAVQHIVPFIVSVFSNIPDYIDQRKTGPK
jgi:hypothetical protein